MATADFSDSQKFRAITGHLRTQFEAAKPILFTGAGFSLNAKNIGGSDIPSVRDLRLGLWKLCFGEEVFEESNSLQDLFQMAKNQRRNETAKFLTEQLTIDAKKLPSWYKDVFSFPWHRCYTLNLDNLATAADRSFALPRPIKTTSATSQASHPVVDERRFLHVVHLNGTLDDLPDNVTFSFAQYAERLSRDEPWYHQLISDLLSRPVVFIGTQLDEPPLWQYVEKRRTRGGRSQQELRPKSYLVTPSLSKARLSCLQDYNIAHIPLKGHEFVSEILAPIREAASEGQRFLKDQIAEAKHSQAAIPEVAALSTSPNEKTEFLFGAEPAWSDIQSGRAIERNIDREINAAIDKYIHGNGIKPIVLISGTAGTGKGTSLKRAALRLSSLGHRVAWVDSFSDTPPLTIRQTMNGRTAPAVLAIDDADFYGTEISSLAREVATADGYPLVLLGMRAGRIDRVLNPVQLKNVPTKEFAMPGLTDPEIGTLLDVLTREKRLGVLLNQQRSKQEQVFREKCGRQLLVAMIEATSGKPFEQKIRGEFSQLTGEMQRIYALVSVATALHFVLSKNDIIVGSGDVTNDVLNAVEKLVQRQIVLREASGVLRARHRVIADVVFDDLVATGRVAQVLLELASSAAMQIGYGDAPGSRHRRFVQRLTNHDFLKKTVGVEEARHIYASLEPLLASEHNFWLHRGSLEVESSNIHAAENFLSQARALNDRDLNVQTEYGYLLFQKALETPAGAHAQEFVDEALALLRGNIAVRGDKDPHSYHVLGSNMLEWIERGIPNRSDRKSELEDLQTIVEEGVRKHPKNSHLKSLKQKVQDVYLSMAVRRSE